MKKILSLTLLLSVVSALHADEDNSGVDFRPYINQFARSLQQGTADAYNDNNSSSDSGQTFIGKGMSVARGGSGASTNSSASSASSSRPFNFDDYLIKSSSKYANEDESGDEMRLLQYLGEDPYEYMEILGANRIGQWNSLTRNARTAYKVVLTRDWSWADLFGKNPGEITAEKNKKAKNAVSEYENNFGDKAFATLSNDMQAFDDKIANSKDQTFRKQLLFLADSAQLAKKELLKKEADAEYEKFRPSKTAIPLDKIMAEVESLIRSSDDTTVVLYKEIATKLKKIQQEVRSLKNRHQDSIADAVEAATRSQNTAKAGAPKEFYDDVIAELNAAVKAEDKAAADFDEVNQRVKDLIAQQINDSPVDALLEAETALAHLKDELHQLNNQRGTKNPTKIKEQQHKVHLEEQVIAKLKDKVKAFESNGRVLARKVDDLLSKHDDDLNAVLEDLDNKIIKSGSRATKEDKALRDIIEKMIFESKKLESKRDGIKKDLDIFMSDTVKFDDKTENPYEKVEKLKKDLLKVEKELQEKKAKRSSIYAADIKELQKKVDLYKSAIERLLKDEAGKFDEKVEKREKEILKKYSDKKKAFRELLPAGAVPSYKQTFENWWGGLAKQTSEDMIEKIIKPVDKAVAKRLNAKIEEEAASDPVAIAQASLSSASALEIPAATEALVAARLSQRGLNIDNLDFTTRESLARMIQDASQRLIAVMNNPRASDAQKQSEKNTIMQTMVKDVGYLIASYSSGVSADALATRDLSTIAVDKLVNSVVGGPVNTARSSSADSSYSRQSNPSYSGSRQVMPYSGSMNSNYGYANSQNVSRASYAAPLDRAAALQILGLDANASHDEIKSVYYRLAKQYHPDKGGNVAQFQAISEAYAALMP